MKGNKILIQVYTFMFYKWYYRKHYPFKGKVIMTLDDKYNKIEEIENKDTITKEDFIFLETMSDDEDGDIRCTTAEVLFYFYNQDVERIMLKLLKDSDELVRVSACEALGQSKNMQVAEILKKYVSDGYPLIRGYAISSIAKININMDIVGDSEIVDFLKESLETECDDWVKVNYYVALYIMGQDTYFQNILDAINNESYQVRCFAINCLVDIADEEKRDLIIDALKKRLEIEKPECIAVISTIERAVKEINELKASNRY